MILLAFFSINSIINYDETMIQNEDNNGNTPKIKTFKWLHIRVVFDGNYLEDSTFCEKNVCAIKSCPH
jgi:hypothetical protein